MSQKTAEQEIVAHRAWLEQLRDQIWRRVESDAVKHLCLTHEYDAFEINREMTCQEFSELKRIAKFFIVIPHYAGKVIRGVTLCCIPCEVEETPRVIIAIERGQLPDEIKREPALYFQALLQLSSTEANRRLLMFYEIEPVIEE